MQAGAAWRFSGANTIAASTSLTTAAEIVDIGAMTNLGTVSMGAVLALSTGATLTNAAGGRLLVTAGPGVALVAGASGTSLVNAGLLDKTSGSGVSSITTAIANTGQIAVAGGTLNLDGAVTGAGTMTIDAGCALEIQGAAAAGGKVDFDGANGVLELGAAASFAAVVRGFGAGDSLDLRSVAFGASETLAYAGGATSGKLTVTSGAQTVRIALFGQYVAASFKAANDVHGGTDITFMAAPAIAPTLAKPVLGS